MSTTPFTDQLLTGFAPWLRVRDPRGDLRSYLEALGGMFDPVAQIVQDQGFAQDPTLIGWVARLAYGYGDVVEGSDGGLYKSLVTGNRGNDPVTDNGNNWGPASVSDAFIPAWSVILDPLACPAWALPFCGQFVGVPIAPGTEESVARARILAEAGFGRGTLASIQTAIRLNVLPGASTQVYERTAANGSTDAYHFVVVVAPGDIPDVQALVDAVNAVKPAGLQWTLVTPSGYTWNQAVHVWNDDTMSWAETATIQP